MASNGRSSASRLQVVGNTRMDAALDAMRPFGFKEKLVRETIKELLHVYDGKQGWPFIEEGFYKLLIDTILSKQQTCVKDKVVTRREGVGETSSAAMPTAAIQKSNDETFESTKPYRPCYGWISDDDNVDLIHFPVPKLPSNLEKMIGKSRWDDKPDDM